MKRNQKGFSVVELIFILFIVGAIGATGWYVYSKKTDMNSGQTDVQDTQEQEIAAKAGWNNFRNDSLGLSLSYPSRWGSPTTKTGNDEDRSVPASGYTEFDITFSEVPLFILPVVNNKNNYLVQRAGCFNSVGFLDLSKAQSTNSSEVGSWVQSKTSSGNNWTTYQRFLSNTDETTIIESFEVSTTVNPQSYCNGLSVYGSQKVDGNSKNLSEVQFLWSKTASTFGENQPKLDLDDLEDFKNNPTKYISDDDLADLQTMVKSLKSY